MTMSKPRLSVEEVSKHFKGVKKAGSGFRALCPVHDDHDPSLSIDGKNGRVLLKCRAGCENPAIVAAAGIEMYQLSPEREASFTSPAGAVRRTAPPATAENPPIHEDDVRGYHERLLRRDDLLEFLHVKRGLTMQTITERQLGHDGVRYTIPVRGANGAVVNVRRYLPNGDPKMLPYARGYGEGRLYPLDALESSGTIYVMGGELDTLLARQEGLNAITGTLGETSWKDEWSESLRGRDVIVCYDCDGPGREGASKVVARLTGVASSVRAVDLGLGDDGEDFTDFIVTHEKTVTDFDRTVLSTIAQGLKADAHAMLGNPVTLDSSDPWHSVLSLSAVADVADRKVGQGRRKPDPFRGLLR